MSSGVISVFIGRLPAMKIDRAVFADGARERQREAGEQRRQHRRHDDAAEDIEAAGAERLGGVFEVALHFLQRRLHGAHHERHADQRERDGDADPACRPP